MKIKVNVLILLTVLAAIGVITLQVSWLSTSYQITKEKVRIDGASRLGQAIAVQKENAAKKIRLMIIKAIKSKANFYIKIDGRHDAYKIGYDGPKGKIWSIVPLFNLTEEESVEATKDSYNFLINRIRTANIETLKHILDNAFIPTEINLSEEDFYGPFDFHQDTLTLIKLLNTPGENRPSIYRVKYYDDVSGVLDMYANKYINNSSGVVDSTLQIFPSYYRLTIGEKLEALSTYIKEVNKAGRFMYVAQPLFDIDGLLNNNSPVILLTIEAPRAYILSQMLFSLIGSALLLILLGFCLIYLFHTILKQKRLSEIKDDFISNVSHELKTPVATTLAAIQGMQHFDVLKNQRKTDQYLGTAEKEMLRLSTMIDTILYNAIYERKEFNLHLVNFNLKEMLEEMIDIQQSHSKKEVKIKLAYSAKEDFFGDKTHLYNVFTNLIDNAIKYGNDEVQITIDCVSNDSRVKIKIHDNGPGIPSAYHKIIFDKFFRVPRPSDHSIKGHGLGLNYVKNIVEKHKGTIILLKSDSSGSTFEIKLPK
jgi:signal transduction histidine kinase